MRGNVTHPPTNVHTVTGNDAKGVISKVLDAVCAQGGTVVSSRSVRMGGKREDDSTRNRFFFFSFFFKSIHLAC